METISDQLRRHISTSGMTRAEISKATADKSGEPVVSQSTLNRFCVRKLPIKIDQLDAIAVVLGLRLVSTKRGKSAVKGE